MEVRPGFWLAVAAATAFGGVGVLAKMAFGEGWDLPALLATRFFIAALVVLPVAIFLGRGWAGFPAAIALGAVGYVAMTALYFASFRDLPAAAATFMLYLAPVLVSIYAWRFDGGLKGAWVGGLVASTLGLAFMLGGALTGMLSLRGVLLAAGSAVVYSALIVLGKRLLRSLPPARAVLGICAGACAGYSAWALVEGTLFSPRTLQGWSLVVGLGVVSTAIALVLFYAALSRAPVAQVAIVSTLEPVATLALAFVLLAESPPALALVGGLSIIAGAALVAIEPRPALGAHATTVRE